MRHVLEDKDYKTTFIQFILYTTAFILGFFVTIPVGITLVSVTNFAITYSILSRNEHFCFKIINCLKNTSVSNLKSCVLRIIAC